MDLSKEAAVVVLHLIRHFYDRSCYPRNQSYAKIWDVFPDQEKWTRRSVMYAAVYVAAEKYDLSCLKATARTAFEIETPMSVDFFPSHNGMIQQFVRLA